MNSSRFMKMLGLSTGVVLLDIITLSPGLLGVEIGGESALETASGVTLLISGFLVLLYGSYTLLLKPPVALPIKDLRTNEDYIAALKSYKNVKVLKKEVYLSLEQIDRIEKKKITLLELLSHRFDRMELSYKKFVNVINEVEKVFYLNIKSILNKLRVYDASGFSTIASSQRFTQISNKLAQEKTDLYNEFIGYVTGYLRANEEILLKLDKLLMEISQLGNSNYGDVEEMPCMKEIDLLIKQTKFYEQ